MELKGHVAVVTGAGKGIGKTIADKFTEEGAKVALWDFDMSCFAGISSSSDRLIQQVNVKNETEVVSAVEKVVKEFGRIDILVNNAGISRHKPIEEMTLDLWNEVIDTNLKGVFLCCKAVIPVMKKQKRGKIVNIASLGARTGRPGVGVNYAASKAGVIAITQTLAKEVGPSGIYINAIAPGPILTEQTKQYPPEVFATWNVGRAIPKDGLPEDVADGAIFLASVRSDWITGITLDLNGGIFIP
jgi:NAD(P)-dependent dehydrogenase (short-subunit alcohol dehydrogenase family)